MDVEKNQYESQSQLSMETKQQEVDEALRKLKELAQRQEKLAEEAQRKQMTAQEQRWRQEQLRREAEDLKRQLAELSRQQSAQQQASNQQQSGQQSQPSNQQSSSSQQASNQQQQQRGESGQGQQESQSQQNPQSSEQQRSQVQQALNSLQKALDDMRAANEQNQSGDATRSAREASENLKRALKQMDQPQGVGIDKDLERFANRTEQLSETQREVEANLNQALSNAQAAGRRRGVIDPRSAAEIAAQKQQMANELEALQREMRESVHKNRTSSPQGAKKLGEIVNELEGSGMTFRINRSAAEVLYGRARDAAPREGLITEGLEDLERNLREAAAVAANADKSQAEQTNPEELLAQIGELRRALEEARREQQQGAAGAGREQFANNSQQDSERQQGAASDQSGGMSGNQRSGQRPQAGQRGPMRDGMRGTPSNDGGDGPNGLAAWNPNTRSGSLQALELGQGRMRDARELSERVQQLANRMSRGEMSDAELRALQRMAHELRRLSGNPIATNPEAMSKLIDQLELATLAAVQKANPGAPPRTAVHSADSTEYREAVAEYYRRLGGS